MKLSPCIVPLALSLVTLIGCQTNTRPTSSATPAPSAPAPSAAVIVLPNDAPRDQKTGERPAATQLVRRRLAGAELLFALPATMKEAPSTLAPIAFISADEELLIAFRPAANATEAKQHVAALKQHVMQTMTNIKAEPPTQDRLNEMPHTSEHGTATANGKAIAWSIDELQATTPVVIYSQLTQAAAAKHQAAYLGFVKSLQPNANAQP